MRRLITSIAAAGVLVASAFVAVTVTGSVAQAQTTDGNAVATERPEPGAALDEVLAGLVADGTLDQSQADAVKDALVAKHEEIKEEFGERHPFRRGVRRGILRGFLADDVISADEIASLPEDHPLRTGDSPLAELLEDDGQITRAELEQFRQDHPRPSDVAPSETS